MAPAVETGAGAIVALQCNKKTRRGAGPGGLKVVSEDTHITQTADRLLRILRRGVVARNCE
jgi:hypothetical protein